MANKRKMKQSLDALENLPPEELHKHIEEQKRQLKQSSRLAMTALVAIVALCIAWFVSNTQVRGTTATIAAHNNMNFELATTGNATVIDTKKKSISDFISKIGGLLGDDWTLEDDKGAVTSSTKSSIQWNMSSDHQNFANVEGSGQVDDTGDENIGLQPGAYGELTFYIIPKIDGAQTVNCTLQLTAYVEDLKRSSSVTTSNNSITFTQENNEKNVWEITDSKVKKVLSGHIYFFEKMGNGLYESWLQPDENGNLHFSVELNEDTKKDAAKKVTIYWNWPTLISQVLLKNGDTYLGSRSQLFSKETQDEIVKFMNENKPFFFVFQSNETIEENLIETIHSASWNSDSIDRTEYSTINQPYNNADQFLGKTVSYVSLELNATN